MGQKHLQLEQRVQIETLLKEGHNLSYIANTLGYSKATITKEIQRATNHATMGRTVSTRISRRMYKALEGQSLADQKQRLKKSTVKTYAKTIAILLISFILILKPCNGYNYKLPEWAIIREFLSLWLEKLFYFTANFITEISS
ncbi:helix-turn-helix domain-containing protein [Fructobacillus fructosus]|uniref:helix-turn-helix domain-containing protein n=1 Tax=Fructobacillus fructosus TaxID=1631 RepID=UPI0016587963|nr:helix-turn-helix domain-containing protein [Fructobacillus fructosus]MBC9119295.1 helix-turn-helix domain-containing protein [Fructobacillus fructosus]MBD9366878.1 helix-turn-helix domain-containing protein [Leuconostoc mesenteroides]